jgi:hypothetical protein
VLTVYVNEFIIMKRNTLSSPPFPNRNRGEDSAAKGLAMLASCVKVKTGIFRLQEK